MELVEAMTSMGLSGGETVMSVDTYERVAPFLQDLDEHSAQEQKDKVHSLMMHGQPCGTVMQWTSKSCLAKVTTPGHR